MASSAIEAALLATLRADATLTAALPDGIHVALAPQHASAFGLVTLESAADQPVFGPPGQRRAWEDVTYEVAAVTRSTSPSAGLDAAERIETLLEDAALTVAGYTGVSVERVGRVRYPDPDPVDASIVWQHAGVRVRVRATPVYS